MLRRAVLLVFILSSLFGVGIAAARSVGRSQGLPIQYSTILQLTQCRAPCWVGIVPGVTPIGEVEAILRRAYGENNGYRLTYYLAPQNVLRFLVVRQHTPLSYLRVTINGDQRGVVSVIMLQLYMSYVRSAPVALVADLITLFGQPDWMDLLEPRGSGGFEMVIGYGNLQRGMMVDLEKSERVDLEQNVRMIVFYDYAKGSSAARSMPAWRGFSAAQRYQNRP